MKITPSPRFTRWLAASSLAMAVLVPSTGRAVILFDSITGASPALSDPTGVNSDGYANFLSQEFATDESSYWLESVTITIASWGESENLRLRILNDASDTPAGVFATISPDGPHNPSWGSASNSDITFSGLHIWLAPSQRYWIALDSPTETPGHSLSWLYDTRATVPAGVGTQPINYYSTDYSSGAANSGSGFPYRMMLDATPAPEPASRALFLFGGVGCLALRRRNS